MVQVEKSGDISLQLEIDIIVRSLSRGVVCVVLFFEFAERSDLVRGEILVGREKDRRAQREGG
jgi:hypothetical protein